MGGALRTRGAGARNQSAGGSSNQMLQAARRGAGLTPVSQGTAKAKGAMTSPPSERRALTPGGPRIDVYDTPASHAAARDMGMLGFSYAGRVFLGEGHKLPGAPSRQEVLRHELIHAAQSAIPGTPQSRGALERQAHDWDGRSALLSADPGAVYGWFWIPMVIAGGYILLKPNVANAPAPGDPTVASMDVADYGKMIAEAVVLASGGMIYNGVRAAGFSVMASWGATGAAGSMSFRGISDVHGGEFSGVDTYVVDGFTGATIGVVTGGTFRLIGRIPGPTRALSNWFRQGAQNDAAYGQLPMRERLLYEIGQKTLPQGQFGPLQGMTPVERGAHLVQQNGWLRALFPSSTGFARPSGTLLTGPTPGGRAAIRGLFGFSSGFVGNAAFGDSIHDAYGLNDGMTPVPDQDGQAQMGGAANTIIVVPQGREFEWLLQNNQVGDFPVPRDAPGIQTTPPPIAPGADVEPVRGSGITPDIPQPGGETAMG
ncbi:hypothetical protein BWR18_10005 [Tateyamaria omphalii]|uniref:eCIS core domain-containing protein n=2 Tax=Tateyamaria omphalii TaxID=299262 RepID=A0A1P8MVC5_9RHOB|nr:hypothetical protein BWR18_10005 [Tateyamaria omphalii]